MLANALFDFDKGSVDGGEEALMAASEIICVRKPNNKPSALTLAIDPEAVVAVDIIEAWIAVDGVAELLAGSADEVLDAMASLARCKKDAMVFVCLMCDLWSRNPLHSTPWSLQCF